MASRIALASTIGFVLACGGLSADRGQPVSAAPDQEGVDVATEALPEVAAEPKPDPPRPPPMLVQPVDDNGRCTIRNLTTDDVLTTFLKPCDRWSVSAHPKRSEDMLVRIEGSPPRHNEKALPRLPAGENVDAVGFNTDGRIVAYTTTSIDPVVDEATGVATVTLDGTTQEVEFDDMFGMLVCRTYQLDGAIWRNIGKPIPIALSEGTSSPACTGATGVPKLAPFYQPGLDETMPADFRAMPDAPDALDTISNDEAGTTWAWLTDDLAAKYLEFEGARLQAPFAHETVAGWTVLEGLAKDEPASMYLRDDFLLVCTDEAAGVYDVQAGYVRVWFAEGQCPVFWPLDG